MSTTRRTIGINHSFGDEYLQDRVFSMDDHLGSQLRSLRDYFNRRGVDVHTLDLVDPTDPSVDYVLYLDISWRGYLKDKFLGAIPREKRVLVIQEPSNINPSLYYVPWLRKLFPTVFAWNETLLKKHGYIRCNTFANADPDDYRDNPFRQWSYDDKKFLVAINSNRWSYMPTSAYRARVHAFQYFENHCPGEFDLYGRGWNQPRIFYDRWLGYPKFECYRGTIPEPIEAKLDVLSRYRFTLCIENNVNEPGYVDNKFIDCLCARCVPVYYAWEGADRYVPAECFINWRNFESLEDLDRHLHEIDDDRYARYMDAIDRFFADSASDYFTRRSVLDTLWNRLYGQEQASTAHHAD